MRTVDRNHPTYLREMRDQRMSLSQALFTLSRSFLFNIEGGGGCALGCGSLSFASTATAPSGEVAVLKLISFSAPTQTKLPLERPPHFLPLPPRLEPETPLS
eukprot:3706500-Pyramimonas_sp.AAC.1